MVNITTSKGPSKARRTPVPKPATPDLPLDPRQALCLEKYLDPKSPTFGNLLQSALTAGFSESYALNLTALAPAWLSENIGRMQMLKKAERNLDEILDLDIEEPVIGMFGPINDEDGNPLLKKNPKLLSTKADVSKFVAERVGKSQWAPKEMPNQGNTTNIFNLIMSAEKRVEPTPVPHTEVPADLIAEPDKMVDTTAPVPITDVKELARTLRA